MRLTVLLVALLQSSCISFSLGYPVTEEHYGHCEVYCGKARVKHAVDSWKGQGCACQDGRIMYFERDFDMED